MIFDSAFEECVCKHIFFHIAINSLDDWVKREYVPKNILNKMNTIYNIYEPLGVSLIIGAWNYPVQLILGPFLAAIAAGDNLNKLFDHQL